MPESVKLNEVESLFARLEYPVARDDAAAAFEDVTVYLADGEANLGELISATNADTFEGPGDLSEELHAALPVEAVGEPGQSEGDA